MKLTGARVPALDGVRGLAVLLVVATHAGYDEGTAGGVGVAAFFTLSGFLITSLLLEEHAKTGAVLLGRFWIRRGARLVPALLVAVALAVLVELAVEGHVARPDVVVGALTYTANYLPDSGGLTLLGHTWSLAVEEQFYLIWPLLLLGLVRLTGRRALVALVWAVVVGALVTASLQWPRVYHGLDARACGLLVGCLLAWWLHGKESRAPRWVAWLGFAIIGGCVVQTFGARFEWNLMPNVVAVGTALVILGSLGGFRLLEWRLLRVVGERSYGLYLYHPIALFVAVRMGLPVEAGLVFAWAAAEVSWLLVERPIIRWGRSSSGLVSDDAVRPGWRVDAVGGRDAAVVVAGP